MKKKRSPAQQSFKFPFSQQGVVVQRHGAKATKKLGAGGGAHLAGLLHLLVYIQCNMRGTPKNRFTYKTLCHCRMEKKVQENHILQSALYKAMILHTFLGTAKVIQSKHFKYTGCPKSSFL